ncbi:DUF484 family protein [Salinisphaera hydrothermalis]|uniref:Phytochrome sensor protein n=1 Tax=Salinisphaera hydrothermalis (strain C41B8) TaxID=1304275 RepID=A0A084IHV0_SALHC|nr:DUF484 family protein [Salinisphaera hydrothermalis]KEZ76284.1 hypothetical protein C41B8_15792 [Salinisphaera hydrothermalis C41B8]
MNEAEKQPVSIDLDEAEVAAYLAAHPDFLRRHPEAFEAMDVPHASGSAISLIERQVGVLRETNARIQSRFDELLATAKSNEERVIQLNRVARIMAGATAADPMIDALTQCLHDHLAVDRVYVGIQGSLPADIERIHKLEDGADASRALTNVFRRGKPICGELSATQSRALFTTDDDALMTSAALIPLGKNGVHGAIVLASRDPKRFTPDMGTLFVELFGDLLTATLRRLLGAELLP